MHAEDAFAFWDTYVVEPGAPKEKGAFGPIGSEDAFAFETLL